MQGQIKIPKPQRHLPHFTGTVNTTILSIQAYCLDAMHYVFNLQWKLFFLHLINKRCLHCHLFCLFRPLLSHISISTFSAMVWKELIVSGPINQLPDSQSMPSLCFLSFRCSNKYISIFFVSSYKWDFPLKYSKNHFSGFF